MIGLHADTTNEFKTNESGLKFYTLLFYLIRMKLDIVIKSTGGCEWGEIGEQISNLQLYH